MHTSPPRRPYHAPIQLCSSCSEPLPDPPSRPLSPCREGPSPKPLDPLPDPPSRPLDGPPPKKPKTISIARELLVRPPPHPALHAALHPSTPPTLGCRHMVHDSQLTVCCFVLPACRTMHGTRSSTGRPAPRLAEDGAPPAQRRRLSSVADPARFVAGARRRNGRTSSVDDTTEDAPGSAAFVRSKSTGSSRSWSEHRRRRRPSPSSGPSLG